MSIRPITPQMRAWIDQSQGIVRSLATRIHVTLPKSVSYDDLVAYGQLGLMQAAHSFDEGKGVSFQTFAYHRIRGAIYDGLSKMNWSERSLEMRIRAEQMSAAMMEQQIETSQRNAWIQSRASDAESLVRITERVAMIHLLGDCSNEAGGLAELAVDPELSPQEEMLEGEMRSLLRTLVEELPSDERSIIVMTYFEGKTLTEAASRLGKSKSWASRTHGKILEKLARRLASERMV